MSEGRVWLVGTGPGDPELMTLKARAVLERAQVVIYDALVGQGILAMIPQGAKCIDAGKHAGNHTIPQHEMNRIIYEEAAQGQRVVRLKGGDSYMFGRGGEEAEYLAERGTPFEVVPGITSPIAVPAYNGIPVTHRDYASSVTFVTAHKKRDEPLDIDFKALTELDGTCVFMMGVSALPDICRGLLEAGMSADMPAAVLSQGTTAGQKKLLGTITTLPALAERQGVATPAVILVGRVCALAEKLAWRESFPLFGKRILVTRPRSRSSQMTARLRELGAEVVELPSIRLCPIENNRALEQALEHIEECTWLVFTSPTGVEVFFRALHVAGKDARSLKSCSLAALGGGTAKELEKHGCLADLVPPIYENEELAKLLKEKLSPADRVLIPRATIGNPVLTEILQGSGAQIEDIPVYDTLPESNGAQETDKLLGDGVDYVTFTSASTVHSFVAQLRSREGLGAVTGVCIGRLTEEAAKSYGMKTITAAEATIESMCQCIIDHQKGEVR